MLWIRRRPDLLFATATEAEALLGGYRVEALLDLAPGRDRQARRARARRCWRSRASDRLRFEVATRTVDAPDTTGAGDAFDAGFIVSWLGARQAGTSVPAALQRAAAGRASSGGATSVAADRPSSDRLTMADAIRERLRRAPRGRASAARARPVVALESTLISHGLPYPQNLDVARASEAAVRERGRAGDRGDPGRAAARRARRSRSRRWRWRAGSVQGRPAEPRRSRCDGGWAATTVSATMIAAHAAGIRVFATGGIGGVHRGPAYDISSDLEELARTPMAVVCAGPKADPRRPGDARGPRDAGRAGVAVGQDELPGFYARSSGIRAPHSVPDIDDAADLAAIHLGLGLGSAILVCVPVRSDGHSPEASPARPWSGQSSTPRQPAWSSL